MMNSITFGFEFKVHWTLRAFLTILAIPLAPAIFMIGWIISFFVLQFEEYGPMRSCELCFCIEPPRNLCILLTFWAIPFLIQELILLSIWIAVGAIVLVLGVVPFYLAFTILSCHLVVRWCCTSKKRKKPKVQGDEMEKMV